MKYKSTLLTKYLLQNISVKEEILNYLRERIREEKGNKKKKKTTSINKLKETNKENGKTE